MPQNGKEAAMSVGLAYQFALLFLDCNVPSCVTPKLARWRGHFYEWDGASYRLVADEVVEGMLTRWLARNAAAPPLTKAFLGDALLAVRSETTVPDDVLPGTWLKAPPAGAVGPYQATPGGVLDLGQLGATGPVLLPPDPNFFALAALPVTPEAAATCHRWLSFLGETFPGEPEAVQLLQETFAYALLPDCRFERFFLFHGPAQTGKSTAAETLQALLGEGNVSALPLERFGERFALASLVGKLANVVFDASDVDKVAEGVLKALVSGEALTIEQKHCPVGTMRLTAKHVFVANALPRFHDTSDGLWRRLVLLPFERVCPEEERDPGLKAKLRGELPGVLNWALQGLARLHQQGGFTTFPRGARLAGEYRQESNPVALFLEAECEAAPQARVGRQAAYVRYRAWAAANGHALLSNTKFYRAVEAIHPQPEEPARDGRGGDRLFVGFGLREGGGVERQFRLLAGGQAEGA
jgi:putative DNA primase/helicase